MAPALDRAGFFARVRTAPFPGHLTGPQVAGLTALLDAAPAGLSAEAQAYVLATAYHETAATLQPVEEIGRGRGRPYGLTDPATGQVYYGRGYVQLTWKANYAKAQAALGQSFVAQPALALRPDLAAAILYRGMTEGWFTGRRLAEFFGPGGADPVSARRIVNGTDRAETIAGHYRGFLVGLLQGGFGRAVPIPRPPDPASPSTIPTPAEPAPSGGLLRSGAQATGGAIRSGLGGLYDLIHTALARKA
ncbi:glycoside hydrolase family 19 protein [Methylobacterium sp. JK268]